MITKRIHTAESLFKRPSADQGSDAAKLQVFRSRQALRMREAKVSERHQRLEKRIEKGGSAMFIR